MMSILCLLSWVLSKKSRSSQAAPFRVREKEELRRSRSESQRREVSSKISRNFAEQSSKPRGKLIVKKLFLQDEAAACKVAASFTLLFYEIKMSISRDFISITEKHVATSVKHEKIYLILVSEKRNRKTESAPFAAGTGHQLRFVRKIKQIGITIHPFCAI